MGEKEKKSGELGERVATRFLQMIGWGNLLDGIDIPCVKPDKHALKENSKRRTHGLDFLTAYPCPFFKQKLEICYVSMKYRKKYPKSPTGDFKVFIRDVATAMECGKKSEINTLKRKYRVKKAPNTGVVIWLSYEDEGIASVTDDILDFRNIEDVNYEMVYLVDNKKVNFILGILDFARNEFKNAEVEFFYPSSGYKSDSVDIKYSGKILPVQYINSNILPLKIIDLDDKEHFILAVNESFDSQALKQLIWLAQDLTVSWGNRIIICFPDYHHLTHDQEVKKVKLTFSDERFLNKIEVKKYSFGDFRTLEEE